MIFFSIPLDSYANNSSLMSVPLGCMLIVIYATLKLGFGSIATQAMPIFTWYSCGYQHVDQMIG